MRVSDVCKCVTESLAHMHSSTPDRIHSPRPAQGLILPNHYFMIEERCMGERERAQWLSLAARSEDPCSNPTPTWQLITACTSSSKGPDSLTQTYIHAGKTPILILKKNEIKLTLQFHLLMLGITRINKSHLSCAQ